MEDAYEAAEFWAELVVGAKPVVIL